jgi:hypothetical protein
MTLVYFALHNKIINIIINTKFTDIGKERRLGIVLG